MAGMSPLGCMQEYFCIPEHLYPSAEQAFNAGVFAPYPLRPILHVALTIYVNEPTATLVLGHKVNSEHR